MIFVLFFVLLLLLRGQNSWICMHERVTGEVRDMEKEGQNFIYYVHLLCMK